MIGGSRESAAQKHPAQGAAGVYSFALIEISALVPHEEVDEERLDELIREIERDGSLRSPVMVDRRSMVILDGHHRARALTCLGCRLIPVYLVDYEHPSVVVRQWRPEILVDKDSVVEAGLSGRPYPPKVSRHEWGVFPEERPIPLSLLRELGDTELG